MSSTEWRKDAFLIAVMGMTGSGKSNFLQKATGLAGDEAPVVGHNLQSCTQETTAYHCTINEKPFIFLDTPGFNDTTRGEVDVLRDISDTLAETYRDEMRLSGIVYIHSIKEPRMTNALLKNLTLFMKICGSDAFRNVCLLTTRWDDMKSKEVTKFEANESELQSNRMFWGIMKDKGSRYRRFLNTHESSISIIREIAGLPPQVLKIQHELVTLGRELKDTEAGKELNREYEEKLDKMREELKTQLALKDEAFAELAKDTAIQIRDMEREQFLLHRDFIEKDRIREQDMDDRLHGYQRDQQAFNERNEQRIRELERILQETKARFEVSFDNAQRQSEQYLKKLAAMKANRSDEAGKTKLRDTMDQVRWAKDEATKGRAQWTVEEKEIETILSEARRTGGREKEVKITEARERLKRAFRRMQHYLAPIASVATVVAMVLAIVAL